jgi:hypothetical protein
MIIGGVGVFAIAFEGKFGSAEAYWAGGWFAYVLALDTIGLIAVLVGWRKRGREVEAGYTLYNSIYAKNPDLYALDAMTLKVVAEPSVAWKSLSLDRMVAGFRGEDTYTPDDSWKAAGSNRAKVEDIAQQQHQSRKPGSTPSSDSSPE